MIRERTGGQERTTGTAGREQGRGAIPATVNDQWNYLLKSTWDQMIHLVICAEGRFDLDLLEQAVTRALRAEPLSTARFIPGDPPYFVPAAVDHCMPGFAMARNRDADQALADLLASPLDPATGPMARIRLLRSDTDLLCISFNHTVTDAYGVKAFGSLVARLYRSGAARRAYFPAGNSHSRSFDEIFSILSRGPGNGGAGCSSRVPGSWRIPFISMERGSAAYATSCLERETFLRICHSAHSRGVTVNDLLLSAYFLSLLEHAPPSRGPLLRVLTSIDLRRYLAPDSYPSLANLSVAFELPMTSEGWPDPAAVVRQVHARMAACKSRHAGIGAAALVQRELESGFPVAEARHVQTEEGLQGEECGNAPFFTNLGVIPEGVTDYGIPVRDAWMLGPVEYPPGLCIAASTFRGRLTLSSGYSPRALKGGWIRSLLSSMTVMLPRLISLE